MNNKLVRNGMLAAGFMNIFGVLVFSRLFSNTAINEADPVVMSNFGLLMIMVWGLAYIGAASIRARMSWLVGTFAAEKLVYVAAWVLWHSTNSVTELYAKDVFAGVFFTIYGINDFGFMLFFIWVLYLHRNSEYLPDVARK